MSIATKVFEVKVRAGRLIKSYLYYPTDGTKTHEQAAKRAKKHGKIISVEKIDVLSRLSSIEHIKLDEEPMRYHLGGGIYEDELDIDRLLGLGKRQKRRSDNADKQQQDEE